MIIFFAGDVVGRPGRSAIETLYPAIRNECGVDVFIANCENAAGGSGVTPDIARQLHSAGVNVITTGDHIWKEKSILQYIDNDPYLLKPANMPPNTPGVSYSVFTSEKGTKVGVTCLLGRTFMPPVDCPFRTADEIMNRLKEETSIIVVDIHAEATSEKVAMGWYLDGRATAVIGSHTHVQTADETILPQGTAYITDIGMTGPFESVIGRETKPVLHRFLTQMPAFFKVARNDIRMSGVIIDVNEDTGKAKSIKRVQYKL
jgi:metallophosphoesterase (TIGR00282 family)